MARINVSGNGRAVIGNPSAGGLGVVFGGVEVFEVRAIAAFGWRKGLIFSGMIVLAGLALATWLRSGTGEMTLLQIRQGIVMTGLAALYAFWAVRQIGVVWRFDHKRKTITRKHWLRGMSRNWQAEKIKGLRIEQGKSRFGGALVQLGLIDQAGKLLAELGCWNKEQVDMAQVETVISEIKKVMWWK